MFVTFGCYIHIGKVECLKENIYVSERYLQKSLREKNISKKWPEK